MPAADFPAGLRTADRVSSIENEDAVIIHQFEFDNLYGARVWGLEADVYWTVALTKNGTIIRRLTGLPRMPHLDSVANVNTILDQIAEAEEGAWEASAGVTASDERGRAAYIENRSGIITYSTGPGAIIEGLMIAVRPSVHDLEIKWGLSTGMAVGGEGSVQSLLYETTGGGATIKGICAKKYDADNIASAQGMTHEGRAEGLGPSDVWRTFLLFISHYSATGSAIVGYVTNADTDYGKSYLMGEYV